MISYNILLFNQYIYILSTQILKDSDLWIWVTIVTEPSPRFTRKGGGPSAEVLRQQCQAQQRKGPNLGPTKTMYASSKKGCI